MKAIHILLFVALAGSGTAAELVPQKVLYRLQFSKKTIDIAAYYPDLPYDSVVFEISPWAGVTDFYRQIREINAGAENRDSIGRFNSDSSAYVVHSKGKSFRLAYSIGCDKVTFAGKDREDLFRATILPDMAYAWGVAVFLLPTGDTLNALSCSLQIDRGPYRMVATSIETDTTLPSLSQLRDCILVAGEYRQVSRHFGPVEVNFYMHGSFAFSDSQFTGAVGRILEAQMNYMGSYPLTRQTVVLVPGSPNSSGGTVTTGVIAVYPDPTDSLNGGTSGALRLISHEHFHVWNEKLQVSTDHPEGYFKWFTEGLADYYAALTMYREGLMSDGMFVDALNRLIRLYYGNPYAFTATAESLAVNYWRDSDNNHLPYHKGALIGLLVDLGLAQQTILRENLDSYLQKLMAERERTGSNLNDSILLGTLNTISGNDWSDFYQQYMLGASELPLEERLAALDITVKRMPANLYTLGFQTVSGRMGKNEEIRSVLSESRASAAGLLPGDTLAGYSYQTGDTTRAAEIKVRRNGELLSFAYIPVLSSSVPQIVADLSTTHSLAILLRVADSNIH